MKDLHIHMSGGRKDSPKEFKEKCLAAGVDGGAVFSLCPQMIRPEPGEDQRWQARMEQILEFTSGAEGFLPIFYIDPTEIDAMKQIEAAAEYGFAGFKIICSHFLPGNILLPLCSMAETGLPVLFHSGILYDERCSSRNNRPIEFECLMDVPNLHFSMAHVSWPWCDELIALCGKFNHLDEAMPGRRSRMHFDITPGTPPIFRRDALFKIFLSGYPVEKRVIWGTDNVANNYNIDYARYWANLDRGIIGEIAQNAESFRCPGCPERKFNSLWEAVSENNFQRFFGKQEGGAA
ncbi:MAG TPA: hypothetical protein DE060_06795 [Lentisphaeria bacterium]|nr:hypothetical protein [Lentisphaeria bacterium]HCG48898.1 hypothetical protein [Lentisphaeria bacterium]